MPDVDIVCLANSYKYGGRCIAGLRTDGGGWIRPVSTAVHGEFQNEQLLQLAGFDARILDVIRVGISTPQRMPYQPENWSIEERRWRLVERPAADSMAHVVAAAVWPDSSLLGGTERHISEAVLRRSPAAHSLALVKPEEIHFQRVFDEHEMRLKDRVIFRLGKVAYDLPLTDPVYLAVLSKLREGDHTPAEIGIPADRKILLTISLGEPYHGICYKLVATIVVVPRNWEPHFEK